MFQRGAITGWVELIISLVSPQSGSMQQDVSEREALQLVAKPALETLGQVRQDLRIKLLVDRAIGDGLVTDQVQKGRARDQFADGPEVADSVDRKPDVAIPRRLRQRGSLLPATRLQFVGLFHRRSLRVGQPLRSLKTVKANCPD